MHRWERRQIFLEAPGAFRGLSLSQVEQSAATAGQEVGPFPGPLPTAQIRTPGAEGSCPMGLPSLPCPQVRVYFSPVSFKTHMTPHPKDTRIIALGNHMRTG